MSAVERGWLNGARVPGCSAPDRCACYHRLRPDRSESVSPLAACFSHRGALRAGWSGLGSGLSTVWSEVIDLRSEKGYRPSDTTKMDSLCACILELSFCWKS